MVANVLPANPPPPRPYGIRSICRISTFLEHGHVAQKNKGNHKCSNMAANILPRAPLPPTLGVVSIGQNLTYSEHGHVAYKIQGNEEIQQHCSKYFARRHPLSPRP